MLGNILPGLIFTTLAIFKALIKWTEQTRQVMGAIEQVERPLAAHGHGCLLAKVRPPIGPAKQQRTTDENYSGVLHQR